MGEVVRFPSSDSEPLWREQLGDRLRQERQAREERLVDVAERAGVSTQYLSEVERGRKEASSEVLAAAAGALGLGLADLLARTHAELVRVTSRRPAAPTGSLRSSSVRNGGLCLAA